jgi:hypothetical protein
MSQWNGYGAPTLVGSHYSGRSRCVFNYDSGKQEWEVSWCSGKKASSDPAVVVDFGDFRRRLSAEDIAEIALRVEATAPAAEQQRIHYRTAPPGLRRPDEQPAPSSHRRGTNGILDEIVVDFKTTVPLARTSHPDRVPPLQTIIFRSFPGRTPVTQLTRR